MTGPININTQEQRSWHDAASARRVILVDAAGNSIKGTRKYENQSGAAGTGADGAANRTYTLTTSDLSIDIVEVYLDGVLIVPTTAYTKDNTAKTITIILNVFNSQTITVVYYV